MLKVLIVDDSLTMRNKLKSYIESMGHEVVGMAKNGRQGVLAVQECMPDVVTMDINMPDMNGIEAVKLIVAESLDINIIMVTAIGQEKVVMSALSAGAIGYLLKPLDETKMVKLFSQIWNKRKGSLKHYVKGQ